MSGRLGRALRLFFTYLTQRLTPAGRSLLLIWMVAGLQGSVGLDIPIYHIWSFTTVCFALAWITSRFAVPNLRLTRHHPPPTMVGTNLTYNIEIENCSRRTAYALSVMETDIPAGFKLARQASPPFIDRLAPRAKITLSLQLHSLKRGHYKLSGLYAASSYPLGLLQGMSFHVQDTWVTVLPTTYTVPTSFHLPVPPSAPEASQGLATTPPMADVSPDFAYIRAYRHGDPPRHLHWASWARTGMLNVKVYHKGPETLVGLVLDTNAQNTRDMHALESGISAMAGIANYLLGHGVAIACLATAERLRDFMNDAPDACFTHIMHELAGLQPSPSVAWPAVANRLLERMSGCHAIVLIALDWSRQTAAFVNRLQAHGIGVRTLVIRQGPTSLPPPATTLLSLLRPGNPWPQEASHSPWRGP